MNAILPNKYGSSDPDLWKTRTFTYEAVHEDTIEELGDITIMKNGSLLDAAKRLTQAIAWEDEDCEKIINFC